MKNRNINSGLRRHINYIINDIIKNKKYGFTLISNLSISFSIYYDYSGNIHYLSRNIIIDEVFHFNIRIEKNKNNGVIYIWLENFRFTKNLRKPGLKSIMDKFHEFVLKI